MISVRIGMRRKIWLELQNSGCAKSARCGKMEASYNRTEEETK